VRTIAVGRAIGPFAAAEIDRLFDVDGEFQRFEFGTGMGTITERLIFGSSAGAPEMGPRFTFDGYG